MKKVLGFSLIASMLWSGSILALPKAVGTLVSDGTVLASGTVRATLANNSPLVVGGVYEVVGNSSVFRMEDVVLVASKGTKVQVLGAGYVSLEKGSLQFKVSNKGKLTVNAGMVSILAGNLGIRPVSSSEFSSGIITKTDSLLNIRILEGSVNILAPEGRKVLKAGETYTIQLAQQQLAQAQPGVAVGAATAGATATAVAVTTGVVIAGVVIANAIRDEAASPASP